jgi:hypothetical protein
VAAKPVAKGATRAEVEAVRRINLSFLELAHAERIEFPPAQPPLAAPVLVNEQAILARLTAEACAGISRFDRKRRNTALDEARQRADEESRRLKAEAEMARGAEQEELDSMWRRLLANEPEVIFDELDGAFEDSEVPAAPLDVQDDRLVLAVSMPPVEALVPGTELDDDERGRPTVYVRDAKTKKGLWCVVMGGNILAAAKEAFAVCPGINYASVLGFVKDDNEKSITLLYVGTFSRPQLAQVDWGTSDALDVLNTHAMHTLFQDPECLVPLDVTDEPQLEDLVRQIAAELHYDAALDPSSEALRSPSGLSLPLPPNASPMFRALAAAIEKVEDELARSPGEERRTELLYLINAYLDLQPVELRNMLGDLDRTDQLAIQQLGAWNEQWIPHAEQLIDEMVTQMNEALATMSATERDQLIARMRPVVADTLAGASPSG